METTQIYTHVMRKPGIGVVSPPDDAGEMREESVEHRVENSKPGQTRRHKPVVRVTRPTWVEEGEYRVMAAET